MNKIDRFKLQKAGDRNKAGQLLQQISAEVGNDADLDRALLLLDRVSQIDRPARTDVDGTEILAKTDRERTSATSPSSEQVESDPNSTVKEPESTKVTNRSEPSSGARSDTEKATSDTNSNLIPAPPELTAALGDLQGLVRISVDPNLGSKTIRVYHQPDVHIKVGRDATPEDLKIHLSTVRTMRTYEGFIGKVRALLKRVNDWIKRNGEPPVGSRAWEAKLELEKLPQLIELRLDRLATLELDP
ncbi:MAG: hypothetical protein ACFBSE_03135, partial [Prochloraceae cyanobacterium]